VIRAVASIAGRKRFPIPSVSGVLSAMPEPTYPAVGEDAPAFSLSASTGQTISLGDYAGRTVVVLF
jgi:hypothetical protein